MSIKLTDLKMVNKGNVIADAEVEATIRGHIVVMKSNREGMKFFIVQKGNRKGRNQETVYKAYEFVNPSDKEEAFKLVEEETEKELEKIKTNKKEIKKETEAEAVTE